MWKSTYNIIRTIDLKGNYHYYVIDFKYKFNEFIKIFFNYEEF